jgi:hypothetical protein
VKKIKPIIVKPPKKRIPNAPPQIAHKSRKTERERVPSGRLEKYKKRAEEE